MKKTFTLFLLIAFYCTQAQYNGKFVTDNTGSSVWSYFSNRIVPCTDGGLLFMRVYTNQTTFIDEMVLVKTDSLFNQQWSYKLGNLNTTAKLQDIGEIPGGGYYVFLNDNNNGSASSEIELLMTFDNTGNLLWQKEYDVPFQGIYSRSRIKFFPSGDYLMIISDYAYAGYIIISPNGTMIRGEGIKADSSLLKNPGFDAVVIDDSTFTLSSKSDNENYFATLSKTGNVISAKKMLSPNQNYYHQPRSIIKLADGNLLVSGLFQDSTIACAFVMKIDQQYNVIWRKLYASALFTGLGFNEAVETANGDLLVKDEYNLVMMLLNAQGQIKSVKLIDGNNSTTGFSSSVVLTSTNKFNSSSGTYHPAIFKNATDLDNKCLYADYSGFVMFSPPYNPTYSNVIYRIPFTNNSTDAAINLTPGTYSYTLADACMGVGIDESGMMNSELRIYVYPNPASDIITFNIAAVQTNEACFIRIKDVSGKLVLNERFNTTSGQINLPVAHLANGIYLAELGNSTAKSVQKIIISH